WNREFLDDSQIAWVRAVCLESSAPQSIPQRLLTQVCREPAVEPGSLKRQNCWRLQMQPRLQHCLRRKGESFVKVALRCCTRSAMQWMLRRLGQCRQNNLCLYYAQWY